MARPLKEINWDIVEKRMEAGNNAKTICQRFNIDTDTFYRRFKEKYGCSFGDYSAHFLQCGDDDIDYDTIYQKDEFLDDANLLSKIHLDKFNKTIFLRWYDTEIHSIKNKIETRTPVNSISEFNEILNDSLVILFEKYFDKIAVKMNPYKNKIAVHIPDLMANVVIQYDVDNLFEDLTHIAILSVVPRVTLSTVNRVFNL